MRIKINSQQVQRDILRIQRKLQRLAGDIKDDSTNKLQEVGMLGFNCAYGLAPYLTGALRRAMRWEFTGDEFLIISSHPMGDIEPIHLLWDTGEYPKVFPTYEIKKPEGLFFMKKTAIALQQEFANRLKMAISHSIQKIGGKGR